MIGSFEFDHDGRTYSCTVEAPRNAPSEKRWWFSVSRDAQRYSPCEAKSSDTQKSVQKAIITFYENRLYRLAQPPEARTHWGGRPKAVKAADPDLAEE